ncbi:hypothetical protein I0P70_14105 [Pontibacter sp. FD36]|uniref:hypothetical protein n=1 Tax=Pontibacter sp. FD36 TaxID=2789860 RepID=UPI0018AC316B|nr:hypothetical protein [Pontibacter sp. FD36]MBF8964383.1 hypothetical protein [Pontibacter sp. FD36]
MKALQLDLATYNVAENTYDENIEIEGGNPFIIPFLAIGGAAAAGLAIYEAGKATGEFIYHITR